MNSKPGFARGGIVASTSRDDDSVPAILSRGCEIVSREQAEALGLTVEAKRLPSHLWPCGCLRNDAGAHRVGCPDHPEGVRAEH